MKLNSSKKKISEIIIENDKSNIKVKEAKSEGKYPFYTSGIKIKAYDKHLCDGSNIFIATGGKPIIQFYEGKASYSTDCYAITTKQNVVTKYLFYFLKTKINEIDTKMFEGAALRHLQKKKFKDIEINSPTLAEQQRIVAKLDRAFAEIDKMIVSKKFNIEKTKKIENSFLKKLLNGDFSNKKIGDICELVYGKGLSKDKRIIEKKGVPVYGANGIKSYTTNPLYQKQSIIVGRKGSAGELQWVDKPFWALDVTYYVVADDKQIKLKYLYYLLKMQNLPKLAKGVKPGINRNDVYNINIKLPLINEQIKIIENLEKIFEQKSILLGLYKKQITNYIALKSAILAKELKHKAA